MGIVSSAFASLTIRFAWNCQRFLDPRYRYIEASSAKESCDELAVAPMRVSVTPDTIDAGALVSQMTAPSARLSSNEAHQVASAICHPNENNNSLHQENRHRRAAQHRYRKRPSSFDVSLIIRNKSKTSTNSTPSGLVTHSTPSTLKRQPAPGWDSTSTSGSSSDDSEIEFMYAQSRPNGSRLEEEKLTENRDNASNEKLDSAETRWTKDDENPPEEFSMSAAEEAAFRMTVGRGHFSRSKKDRFLNNLRLEKRLNGLNKEFFELACRAHTRSMRRRHSGDLRRIV